MRLVLAYRTFASFAGSESYLLTMAEQLQLLGHEVLIHTRERGEIAAVAEGRGVRVVDATELPEECDGVLAQDGELAHALATRYPGAPRIYVAHSTEYAGQMPPQAEGVCQAVVVMNDRVAAHVRASAFHGRVERLRQPVDVLRFSRLTEVPDRPRRVLVFGHDHAGAQLERIRRVCGEIGMEADHVGAHGRRSAAPEKEIAAADVVIGIGRCVIEAMAARKAAYVSGVVGTDGWVTPESYPALEADGFSGRATGMVLEEGRLRADLLAWTSELGEWGKDLAFAGHDAGRHASRLVELWGRLGASPGPDPAAAAELERLTRVTAQLEQRALGHAFEAGALREEVTALIQRLEALTATRRYRLSAAAARPMDRLRQLLGRTRDHD